MGRMKKFYELAGDGSTQAGIYFIGRTAVLTKTCNDVLDRIRTAEHLIGDFLIEGHITDLHAAKAILGDAINLLEGPSESANRASQPTADAG